MTDEDDVLEEEINSDSEDRDLPSSSLAVVHFLVF
jgi:hypothetical protein